MAKFILTSASGSVNGVDLSAWAQKVAVETTRDQVDVTAMGATYKVSLAGLGDAKINVTFFSDFAASATYATLATLATTNTPFNVIVKPVTGTTTTTNPSFMLSALMYGFKPIDGSVGD